jgi:light-regulated signal transduction histidine kinase (bacteriophytochrome)
VLRLSRVTRKEMSDERVDLSEIAKQVALELRTSQPERRAEIHVQDALAVRGDPSLLRAAMENLLGNAWKFTGKKPSARIEFGSVKEGSETAYFVRDNGAGFDMAYADKLFAPFERLHPATEFSGSGIGLAAVQRIIRRHGGRIWAQGAPGEGATFYFTLKA